MTSWKRIRRRGLSCLAGLGLLLACAGTSSEGSGSPAGSEALGGAPAPPALQPPSPAAVTLDVGQRASLEAVARRLVDPEAGARGDRDAVVADWLDGLAAGELAPLDAAALTLIGAVVPDLDDPAAYRERVLTLDPAALAGPDAAVARTRLGHLQAGARAAEPVPLEAPFPDQFPQVLSTYDVLGPLGPAEDPLDLLGDGELFAGRAAAADGVEGLVGPVTWLPFDRGPGQDRLRPSRAFEVRRGWTFVSAPFHARRGGPAILEIDMGSAAQDSVAGGSGALFTFGGSAFRGWADELARGALPSFAFALNGGAPEVVDLLEPGWGSVVRHPVQLVPGCNELVLRTFLAAEPSWRIRVLDATTGEPWDGLVHERAALAALADEAPPVPGDQALAGPVAPAGSGVPVDALDVLQSVEPRGPDSEALLGLLLLLDRRPAEGLRHLEQAARDDRPGLLALQAGLVNRVAYLPESVRSSRARSLEDAVLARVPDHIPAAIARANRLVAEDQHEQAIALLTRVGERHPRQSRAHLRLVRAHAELGMEAAADAALQEALARTPHSPLVLAAWAERWRQGGWPARAAEVGARQLEAVGLDAGRLESRAQELAGRGRRDEAREALLRALRRDPTPGRQLRAAAFDLDGARADLGRAALADPLASTWAGAQLLRADLAALEGDEVAELEALRRALDAWPSDVPTRERLAALAGQDEVEELFAAWRPDRAAALAAYDDEGRDDSTVKVLDVSVVRVFDDGSTESLTHDLVHVRDLDGVEAYGEVRPPGEVERILTLKADGREFEPVKVGDSYVMPNLEPGDFVELVYRMRNRAPSDGVVRLSSWRFQSTSEPFVTSRYVVAVPDDLGLRVVQRRFEGEATTRAVGGLTVHAFEARDMPRIVRQNGAPDPGRLVPWVQLGQDDSEAGFRAGSLLAFERLVQVTPEIRDAVAEATTPGAGQEQRARELHALVGESLDRRVAGAVPAIVALLEATGEPHILYASLLRAAGISHDLVFTRDVAPAGDPDPVPAFVELGSLQRRLVVRVRPDDGDVAWCDLSARTLPFGHLMGNAPGAEAIVVGTGERLRLPERPAERSGEHLSLEVHLARDGSARVQGSIEILGGTGYATKEQLEQTPAAYHKIIVQQAAGRYLGNLELTDFSLEGLDDPERRTTLGFSGSLPRFLDDQGWRRVPLASLELTGTVASEGRRTQPFLSGRLEVASAEILFHLEPGLELAHLPRMLRDRFEGWDYELTMEEVDASTWRLVRRFEASPFLLPAERYDELVDWCVAVDDVEGARLRFQEAAGA